MLAETEAYLHEKIPLTRAMGVRVVAHGPEGFAVEAPLELNHNHLGTAFGGSLNALAILAGYGWLWLELRSRDAHVVIAESSTVFRRPVLGAPRAICRQPDAGALAVFRQRFERKGKAPITLEATIEENGLAAVEFKGVFVAMR